MPDFLSYPPEADPNSVPPKRVYARVDSTDPASWIESESRWLYLECVDANQFDVETENGVVAPELIESLSVSVVEIEFSRKTQLPRGVMLTEGAWFEFELDDDADYPVYLYLNLFTPPLRKYLKNIKSIKPWKKRDLEKSCSTDHITTASRNEIETVLQAVKTPDAAAVYDVGQGNWNALVDSQGIPLLHFDLGGGVLGNTPTFPAAMNHLCKNSAPHCAGVSPPVVLSHWDWDHWSFAQRDPTALNLKWIAPRQKVGNVHAKFIARIHKRGNLLYWPSATSYIDTGTIRVERCTGNPKNRNHSGLAMLARDAAGMQTMLFTGDCRYTAIPSRNAPNLSAVVVPHHGGRLAAKFVPATANAAHNRLVYSYGQGNQYRHPHQRTVASHAAVWKVDLRTEHRQAPSALGHVHMYWNAADPTVSLACGGAVCELVDIQR